MKIKNIIALTILVLFVIFAFAVGFGIFDISAPSIRDYQGWLPSLIFISALIDSVNPCAFSILFLTIAFLFSLNKTRKRILIAGAFYIVGIYIVYTLIGLGVLRTLNFFNVPHFISKVGAIIIIIFGVISLVGELFPNFPIKLKIPSMAKGQIAYYINKATMPASFILGLVVGIHEFPCTGGPYLFILGLLHDETGFWRGLGYLLFYNLIFVLPLIVILIVSSNRQTLEAVETFRKNETRKIRIWIPIVMIVLGGLIFMI